MMRMWLMALVDQIEAQQAHASALGAQVRGATSIISSGHNLMMLFSTDPRQCTLKEIFARSICILKGGCNF